MRFERMELLGVCVKDLDEAVARYTALFGINLHIFRPGVDYDWIIHEQYEDPQIDHKSSGRLALDEESCFELVEMPNGPEGMRNIHFRTDSIAEARSHCEGMGLRLVKDMTAGTVRELVFNSEDLDGVRLCVMEYEGPSLAHALLNSPPPKEK